jgi:hypothetical protein
MAIVAWAKVGIGTLKIRTIISASMITLFCWLATFTPSFTQTYTTSGLSDNWDNPAAWIKTNPDGCISQNPGLVPPTGPVFFPACPIRIVINHPITRTATNSNFGGGLMVSLTINTGGRLSTTGNMGGNNSFQIQMNDGAQMNVNGTLSLQSGATLNMVNATPISPSTNIQATELRFLNSGSANTLNIGANTIVEVQTQTRLEGGGILNIQGSLVTQDFNSVNAGGNQVNISGDGTINTTRNMVIDGFPMNLSGNAGVVVAGNLTTTNNGGTAVNLTGPATGFIVLDYGSNILTEPTGSCFQTPENSNACSSSACVEVIQTENYNLNVPQGFDRIYIFRCSYNWRVPDNTETEEILDEAEILIVAGGGGGGRGASAGGGGAGGLLYIESEMLIPGATIPITIGRGGLGSTSTLVKGANGGNSLFGISFVALGGGGGGSSSTTNNDLRIGNSGGSGGGGAYANGANGGLGSSGQGNNGAPGGNAGSNRRGAGGGGAGAAGTAGTGVNGGNGGQGFTSDITNSNLFYAAGGGGLGTNGTNVQAGNGGSGIGGQGNGAGSARNGRPNTGSGGGATSADAGGNGASGIVIVRQSFRILPVDFLYVDANFRRENREVLVTWATGKEWNNSHFEIQRSDDGLKTWKTLDNVTGKGWSDTETEYQYADGFPPLIGGLLYYRIKQVDFDGRFALSKVVAVRVPQLIETKGTWLIYPNPVRNQPVRLELADVKGYQGEDISLRIIHPMGEAVSNNGTDLEALQTWMSGVFSRGQRGVYVVEISWGKYREYHKVLSRE